MCTSNPSASRASASCQTRRSNGHREILDKDENAAAIADAALSAHLENPRLSPAS